MKKKQYVGIFLAALLGGVIAIGGFKMLSGEGKTSSDNYITIEEQQKYNLTGVTDATSGFDFKQAAKKTTPAVVHIKTYKKVDPRASRLQQDPFFRDFFGGPRGGQLQQPQNDEPQHAASGSGVILTGAGYIATNNHVVEGSDKVKVVLYDKREFEAEVVGTDPTTDLALLKIEGDKLPFIPYGNSDRVEVGEWVLAVGNPFNLNSTVTAGIVSAKGRNINILRDKENMAIESFIQTDAVVNPGNSGGALVNVKGELIGINTAIASPTGSYAGYSFAVPTALVKKVMQDLKEFGQVQRALLGVTIRDVNAELKNEKGLNNIEGVYVEDVRSNSAGAAAGIQPSDVILQVSGKKVNSSAALQEAVALHRPGDKVEVVIKREGAILKKEVVLRNKLGTTEIVKKGDRAMVSALGAQLRPINKKERLKYSIDSGIMIASIGKGILKESGLHQGDIILKINRLKITDPYDVEVYLKNNREGSLLEVMSASGKRSFIGVGW